MKILISIFVLLFLSGCCSSKMKNTTNDLFLDKYIPKLEKYIENDQNLSIRDKNTFYIELKDFQEKRKNH